MTEKIVEVEKTVTSKAKTIRKKSEKQSKSRPSGKDGEES